MAETIRGIVFLTGVLAWVAICAVALLLTFVTLNHALKAWEMSGRIVRETTTKTGRLKWWRAMFLNGPVTSLTTTEDNHTVYWPGREPKGWYAE